MVKISTYFSSANIMFGADIDNSSCRVIRDISTADSLEFFAK